jgi:phage shock protein E
MNPIQELLHNSSTKFIDVRSPMEFASEHLQGAENIPVEIISSKVDYIKGLNQRVLLYCRSGARSAMATSILHQAGVQNVYNGGSVYDLLIELESK